MAQVVWAVRCHAGFDWRGVAIVGVVMRKLCAVRPWRFGASRPKPLTRRPLLDHDDAGRLEELFKVLANDTRLRILHRLLLVPDSPVGEVAEAVGMSTQAVSNQLQRLADRRIVAARREGNQVRYRVVDACVGGLMDLGVCLVDEQHCDTHPRP